MKVISYLFLSLLSLIIFIGWFPQSNFQLLFSNWFGILSLTISIFLGLWSVALSYFGPDVIFKFQALRALKSVKRSFTSQRLTIKSLFYLMKDLNVEDYWVLRMCILTLIDNLHFQYMMFPNDPSCYFDPSRICIIVSPNDTRVAILDRLANKRYLNKVKIPGLVEHWGKCIEQDSFFYIVGWKLAYILDINCDCQSTKARDKITNLSEMIIDYKPTSIGAANSIAFPM